MTVFFICHTDGFVLENPPYKYLDARFESGIENVPFLENISFRNFIGEAALHIIKTKSFVSMLREVDEEVKVMTGGDRQKSFEFTGGYFST